MLQTRNTSTIDRSQAIANLAAIRQQWQDAVGDGSLINAQASVGLLLGDVTMALNFSSSEQEAILGRGLRRDIFRAIRGQ